MPAHFFRRTESVSGGHSLLLSRQLSCSIGSIGFIRSLTIRSSSGLLKSPLHPLPQPYSSTIEKTKNKNDKKTAATESISGGHYSSLVSFAFCQLSCSIGSIGSIDFIGFIRTLTIRSSSGLFKSSLHTLTSISTFFYYGKTKNKNDKKAAATANQ
jgi:hypothetical protein